MIITTNQGIWGTYDSNHNELRFMPDVVYKYFLVDTEITQSNIYKNPFVFTVDHHSTAIMLQENYRLYVSPDALRTTRRQDITSTEYQTI